MKAFAQSRGTRAKTDRIDAELIARFFAFRPEAGRSLPAEKLRLLRALTTKRAQLVEMRKRLLAQIRAHQKLGAAVMFEDVVTELKQRIDSLIKELEDRITLAIANGEHLSETAGGRRALRHVMFQAALVAAHHNPSLKTFADRLRKAAKPHKVIITAVARKLVTIANALCKNRQKWTASGP
ncbi:IS110 family transposase [Pseudotabrizicola sediminis]|uniref:IS110 family transposase n=1 Tax=Pseudotabrizicola sediminis TaxID=2486418 RepID=UPI001FD8D3A5